MSRLTAQFLHTTKPVHVGVYRTTFGCGPGYCMWDGKKWWNQASTIGGARKAHRSRGVQCKRWRGLVRPAQ